MENVNVISLICDIADNYYTSLAIFEDIKLPNV